MRGAEQINRDLAALADAYAAASIAPSEYRRRRRELVCAWTGQSLPEADEADDEATQPKLRAISDEDIARTSPAPQPVADAPKARRSGWWVTALLLLLALAGAAVVVGFVLRRSV